MGGIRLRTFHHWEHNVRQTSALCAVYGAYCANLRMKSVPPLLPEPYKDTCPQHGGELLGSYYTHIINITYIINYACANVETFANQIFYKSTPYYFTFCSELHTCQPLGSLATVAFCNQ